jgi:sulfatase-like protein
VRSRLPFAIYPAAILLLVALHLWAASGISPFAATRALLVCAVVGVGVSALGAAIMRDRHRGGLFAVLVVILLLAGGRPAAIPITVVPMALLLVERYGPRHLSLDWAWVGRMASRVTAVFALAVLLEAIQLGRPADLVTALETETPLATATATAAAPPPADAPDVYVILLDGYARADVLKQTFGYDDSPFLDGLRADGFQVADQSHSNYLVTNLSVSSLLNYHELGDIPALKPLIADPGATEGGPVHRAIAEAAVLDDFRRLGYDTVGVSSGFEQPAVRGADTFVDDGELNEFEIQMMRASIIPPLVTALVPDAFSGNQRQRIESVFETVEDLAAQKSARPRFVFAHVPSPHGPWVQQADGSARVMKSLETWYFDTPETTGMTRDEVIKGYVGQSAYLGKRALEAVRSIQQASARPPIVLVISDHGSSLDVSAANPEQRLRNLFAASTPGHPNLFANDLTLIGVFPTLFDAYFGVELPRAAETMFTGGPKGLFDPVPIRQ